MSTLDRRRIKKINDGSDMTLEKARDSLRYKFGLSKKPPRVMNGGFKRAMSVPNMYAASRLEVAKQPSRPAPGLPRSPGMFGGYLRDSIDDETGASQFVVLCVDAIESTGDNLKTDALYRATGNQAQIQEIVSTSKDEMWGKLCRVENVNVLTGALKLYFRQLKNPLMDYSDFNKALQADDPVEETRLLLGGLPAAERKTLGFLLHHLQKVLEHQDENKMGVQGLGVVFGPTLMRLIPNSLDIGGDMKQQNRIIEFLLTECDSLFPKISHLDVVDGSHKTATLDIAHRHSQSSDSDSDDTLRVKPMTAELIKLRKNSDSSDSDDDKRSDDSSDAAGNIRKRNLMTTIERNRQSGGFTQSGQQAKNTEQQSVSDNGKKASGVEVLYAMVEKKHPKNLNPTAQDKFAGKDKTPIDISDDEIFDLPPPPPVPVDYPSLGSRASNSRLGINIAVKDVEHYNIEAISYRAKPSSDSSDSDDEIKYRKRVTAENRGGMIEHLPRHNETISIVSNMLSGGNDYAYVHSISTINNQYKPAAPNPPPKLPANPPPKLPSNPPPKLPSNPPPKPPANPPTSPPVDSNFNLDTYNNRYKKPLSARQVGDEANKRISAVFRKAPERPDHGDEVLRPVKDAGRKQKSTPVDSYKRRDGSSDSSSSDSDSDDSQHGAVGQAVLNKPTAI